VAVVGGGVSGLATAWFLASRTAAPTTLLEEGYGLRGKVRTRPLAGLPLEDGPDGFVPEPAIVRLCEELGLGSGLVRSSTSEAHSWDGERLRPLRVEDARGGRATPPRLLSIKGGLERLVEALTARLATVDVRRHAGVAVIERAQDGTSILSTRAGRGASKAAASWRPSGPGG
jgi:protoporphyrinogen oxidase